MIDLGRFKAGMLKLGAVFGRKIEKDVLDAFGEVLSGKLTTDQWELAVKLSIERERFFPSPSVLLKYGESRSPEKTESARVYEQIVTSYEKGNHLTPRGVSDLMGVLARDAFVAAGGVRAFEWCEPENEPFRRKAFVEAWVEAAAIAPERALPSGETLVRGVLEKAREENEKLSREVGSRDAGAEGGFSTFKRAGGV